MRGAVLMIERVLSQDPQMKIRVSPCSDVSDGRLGNHSGSIGGVDTQPHPHPDAGVQSTGARRSRGGLGGTRTLRVRLAKV